MELADRVQGRPVLSSTQVFDARIWSIRRDVVDLGIAGQVTRDVIDHPGAVAVLALDDAGRVPLVFQYRHPVGMWLWELPAGLLDIASEPPELAARRELAEEADLRAEVWHTLIDWQLTPGGSSEAMRCYLAQGLSAVPPHEAFARSEEELELTVGWFELDHIRDAILQGRLNNPSVVTGVLAACAARDQGWASLRPADAPWPEHPRRR